MRHTYLWFAQIVTGALIAISLGFHMVIMHLEDVLGFFNIEIHEPASWGSMIERADQVSWVIFYILFLAFVLYHGLNGLRGIVLELVPSTRGGRIVNWLTVMVGIFAFALGTYVPLALFLR